MPNSWNKQLTIMLLQITIRYLRQQDDAPRLLIEELESRLFDMYALATQQTEVLDALQDRSMV